MDIKKVKEDLATYAKINEEEKKRPLLPKSAILKILAEAVRSYSGCAKLITDHSYTAGQSEMVTEVRHKLNVKDEMNYFTYSHIYLSSIRISVIAVRIKIENGFHKDLVLVLIRSYCSSCIVICVGQFGFSLQ